MFEIKKTLSTSIVKSEKATTLELLRREHTNKNKRRRNGGDWDYPLVLHLPTPWPLALGRIAFLPVGRYVRTSIRPCVILNPLLSLAPHRAPIRVVWPHEEASSDRHGAKLAELPRSFSSSSSSTRSDARLGVIIYLVW